MLATTVTDPDGRDPADAYCALVLSFNNWRETLACVQSLLATGCPPQLTILCDNASTDASFERLRDWGARDAPVPFVCLTRTQLAALPTPDLPRQGILLVANEANLGYAGGNNVGLVLALRLGYGFVWLLNNDTEVVDTAPAALLRHMAEHPRCGLCGALTRYMDDPEVVQCFGGGWYSRVWGRGGLWGDGFRLPLGRVPSPPFAPLDYVNGASIFVRRAFLEDVGLLEEAYFLYCEEIDWAQRANGRYSLDFEPSAEVFHKEGLATEASNKRRLGRCVRSSLWLVRSRFLFTYKFYPQMLPTVFLGQLFALIRKLVARILC